MRNLAPRRSARAVDQLLLADRQRRQNDAGRQVETEIVEQLLPFAPIALADMPPG